MTTGLTWANTLCAAFQGSACIATGELKTVALVAKNAIDAASLTGNLSPVLIFNEITSEVIELDWRGNVAEFIAKFEAVALLEDYRISQNPPQSTPQTETDQGTAATDAVASRGPGRPKLGVVAREVTLLPRHWDWLATQTGGTSVALRKLVEVARKESELKDRIRHASAVTYKFMATIAGHEPGFEEASRALFAKNRALFEEITKNWPVDVNIHLQKLSLEAFEW
jgi:uncharacterized protein